jgi:hypothetical protein
MAKKYMNIPVPPEVYQRVRAIADEGGQTMGGLIKVWARQCAHPKAGLVTVGYANITPAAPENSQVTQHVEIMRCIACGQLVVSPCDIYDADQRIIRAAVNAETGA